MAVVDRARKTNSLLREARTSLRSPSGSGRSMSRQELADACNQVLERRYQLSGHTGRWAGVTGAYVGMLERGEVRWPNKQYRHALCDVLGKSETALGFYIDRAEKGSASEPLIDLVVSINGAASGLRVQSSLIDMASSGQLQAAVSPDSTYLVGLIGEAAAIRSGCEFRDEEAFILATADESADHGFLAARSNVNDDQLDVLDRTVDEIAISLLTGPLMPLILQSRHIRDQAFNALRGRQYPRQGRQLYAVAARVCGLLSVVTADRLRLYDAALRHANAASIAADLAEVPALRAWTASIRSSIAFWQANYHTAADIAYSARAVAPSGVESARLASLEARAWARIGNHKAMNAALAAALTARDEAGPSAGPGLIDFPLANQLRLAGTAHLWIGDYARACDVLTQALNGLRAGYDSIWHIAAARVDLADAHVRRGQLDDAAQVLEPLIGAAREDIYLGGAARRIPQLIECIERSRQAGSTSARELSTELRAFAARQKSNGVALAATATVEVPRPR